MKGGGTSAGHPLAREVVDLQPAGDAQLFPIHLYAFFFGGLRELCGIISARGGCRMKGDLEEVGVMLSFCRTPGLPR